MQHVKLPPAIPASQMGTGSRSWLLCFGSNSLLLCLERQEWIAHALGSLHLCRRPGGEMLALSDLLHLSQILRVDSGLHGHTEVSKGQEQAPDREVLGERLVLHTENVVIHQEKWKST